MLLCHWGWYVSGCDFEGLALRSCLAGLLEVFAQTLRFTFEMESRANACFGALKFDRWRKSSRV